MDTVINRLWMVLADWRGQIADWVPGDDTPVRGICHVCRLSPFRGYLGAIEDGPHGVTHLLHEMLAGFVVNWEFLAPGTIVAATREALAEAWDVLGTDVADGYERVVSAERFAVVRDAVVLVGAPVEVGDVDARITGMVNETLKAWFAWLPEDHWPRAESVPVGHRCRLCTTAPVILPEVSVTAPHAVLHELRCLLYADLDDAMKGPFALHPADSLWGAARPHLVDQMVVAVALVRPRIEHALRLYVADRIERDVAQATEHLPVTDGGLPGVELRIRDD